MTPHVPPPGPMGPFDRLQAWMHARRWRRWLVATVLFLVGWTLLFGGWIGVALLRGSTDKDAGAVALRIVLTVFMAAVLLPILHRALYRWFWHLDRKRATGPLAPDDRTLRFGAAATPAPPQVRWPWMLRLRHLALHLAGLAVLLGVFLPATNQAAIGDFLMRHSAGRASAGQLGILLFAWLPLILLCALCMLLLWRRMRQRDAGLLGPEDTLLLAAEMNWLFSYAAAFAMAMLLCQWFGGIAMRYL